MSVIWKNVNIAEFSELYRVSNMGDILSIRRNIILKTTDRNGYLSVCLCNGSLNIKRTTNVHRIVALTFHEKKSLEYDIVNHKNGDKHDNRADNLEWMTYKENTQHSLNTGLTKPTSRKYNEGIIDIKDILGKTLDDYPNYIITQDKKIYSKNLKNFMKTKINGSGYKIIGLSNDGKKHDFYVHCLVAELFIDNPQNKKYVNHMNGIKHDNRIENLEWVTSSENMRHANDTLKFAYLRSVLQLDNDENVIKKFSSVKAASTETGIDSSSIVRVCKGKQITAGGFKWEYLD